MPIFMKTPVQERREAMRSAILPQVAEWRVVRLRLLLAAPDAGRAIAASAIQTVSR
jgi:hypothetical protein